MKLKTFLTLRRSILVFLGLFLIGSLIGLRFSKPRKSTEVHSDIKVAVIEKPAQSKTGLNSRRVINKAFSVRAGKIFVKNNTGQDIHATVGQWGQYFPEGEYEIPVATDRVYVITLQKKLYSKFSITQLTVKSSE